MGSLKLVGQKTVAMFSAPQISKSVADTGFEFRVFGWFTSKGQSLEGNGVSPDIRIENRPEALAANEDEQLNKAVEISQGH